MSFSRWDGLAQPQCHTSHRRLQPDRENYGPVIPRSRRTRCLPEAPVTAFVAPERDAQPDPIPDSMARSTAAVRLFSNDGSPLSYSAMTWRRTGNEVLLVERV